MKKRILIFALLPFIATAHNKSFDYMNVLDLEWATDPQMSDDHK